QRPQCSLADQDAAAIAADDRHHLVVWTDSPCLRAYVGDPWDIDDLRGAIARLTVFRDSLAFSDAIPVPDPPSEMQTGTPFRDVFSLLRPLLVIDRHGFHAMIRALLAPAPVVGSGLLGLLDVFDTALVERVIASFDLNPDPTLGGQAKISDLTTALAALTLEDDTPLGTQQASDILVGLSQVLPTAI